MEKNKTKRRNLFTIEAKYLESEKVYADMEQFGSFESQDEAIKSAKQFVIEVSKKEREPILVHVLGGVKLKPSGLLYGDTHEIYTFSSKNADETLKALKNAAYMSVKVDEYVPFDGDIVIMTVVTLDREGNIYHDIARFDSVEDAIIEGDKRADEWMGEYRRSWEDGNNEDDKIPCIIERYGKTILEIRECDSIAEFDYQIYKI